MGCDCKTHIFAVDDSAISQRLLKEALLNGGFDNVNFAGSGDEALSMLGVGAGDPPAMGEPDAILLDIMMPGIDGIDTCARIRADARYQHTPILMVTAETEMDSLAQAFVAGANDYVRKPFNTIELLARLRSSLHLKSEINRRQERERELVAMTRDVRRAARSAALFDGSSLIPGQAFVEAFFTKLPAARLKEFGVLAMQVDTFPSSPAGDQDRYQKVAAFLASLPSQLGDLLALYEGGTFIAFLRAINAEELRRRAEAIRQAAVAFGEKSHRGEALSIGAVHGSAAENSEPRALLAKAVFAMERAAHEGGNCVVLQQE